MVHVVRLDIDNATKHDDLYDAIADSLGAKYHRIDIGMPEAPVAVDGCTTPLQSADVSYSDVVSWLHVNGGAPNSVYDGRLQVGDVSPEGGKGGRWSIDWLDIAVEIEWPTTLPDVYNYDVDDLARLVAWAKTCNVQIEADELLDQARRVCGILDA